MFTYVVSSTENLGCHDLSGIPVLEVKAIFAYLNYEKKRRIDTKIEIKKSKS